MDPGTRNLLSHSSTTTTMRALTTTLLPLLAAASVLAIPASEQVLLDDLSRISKEWQHVAEDAIRKGSERVMKWVDDSKEFVKQHDITCEPRIL